MAVNWMNSTGIKIFLIIETVLYLSFLSLDINGFFTFSAYLKYLAIIILFVFILIKSIQMKHSFWIPTALGFSVFADYYLLFTSRYTPGVVAFLIVQILLFLRIQRLFECSLLYRVGTLIMLLVLGIVASSYLHLGLDLVGILAMIYFLCFFHNVITSVLAMIKGQHWNDKSCFLFLIGLILFFFCDIHVGIYNLSTYALITNQFLHKYESWVSIAMWLFYLPGQTLIGISNIFDIKITCTSSKKMIK